MTSLTEPRVASAPIAAPRLVGSLPRTVITPRVAPAVERRQQWQRRYRSRLRLTDMAIVLGSVGIAAWIQIAGFAQLGVGDVSDAPWQYLRVSIITVALWLLALAAFQTRATSIVGHGSQEYRRVAHATALAFGILAIGFVILQSQGIRSQLLIALPLGVIGLVVGRWANRRWLVRQRQTGEYIARAIVVGRKKDVEALTAAVHTDDIEGYHIVGVSLSDSDDASVRVGEHTYRAVGTLNTAATVAAQLGADAVIVASTPENDPQFVKRLSWQLEGTAAELVLSSPLVDIAGPRMSLKPVEGMPLIQVEIPTFEGGRYLLKRAMDIAISAMALVVVGLLTPAIAIAIKVDNPGPVFFRQERVGRDGRIFRMVKFRSMRVTAEAERAALVAQNEGSGPLFKMKVDPRVTRVGKFLRRYSLDELPQFWNVLVGDMSIVGPRPPLPDEVTAYDGTVYRRLYIKPGITGPWQVSGRSNLTWDESVRLDLRYVENWSAMNDLILIWRTVAVMAKPEGAY
jgi:exopolysaccharide biosynthesis polyprenyl glycosylphosphotransferase